jgi:hypothetical protein
MRVLLGAGRRLAGAPCVIWVNDAQLARHITGPSPVPNRCRLGGRVFGGDGSGTLGELGRPEEAEEVTAGQHRCVCAEAPRAASERGQSHDADQ